MASHSEEVQKVRPYCIRFASKSALRLNGPRTFTGATYRAIVTDSFEGLDQHSRPQHVGLLFTIEIEAKDTITAIGQSTVIADRICSTLVVTHATAIEDPKLLFALDITPGVGDRELAQVIRNSPEFLKVRREFSDSLFRPFYQLLDTVRATEFFHQVSQPLVSRIDRALHYLRRSYLEADLLDRFEDLTAGLQSIDPRIREKFGQATTVQPNCNSCQKPLYCKACGKEERSPNNWSGIDYIITQVLQRSDKEARQLRIRRNEVAHALKEISELMEGIDELISLAHEVLIAGVLILINAPESYLQSLLRNSLPLLPAPEFLVTVTLLNFSTANIDEQGNYPFLKLNSIERMTPLELNSIEKLIPAGATEVRGMGDIMAIALNMEAANFTEDWVPGTVYCSLGRDPEDLAPDPEVMIQKLRRPQ